METAKLILDYIKILIWPTIVIIIICIFHKQLIKLLIQLIQLLQNTEQIKIAGVELKLKGFVDEIVEDKLKDTYEQEFAGMIYQSSKEDENVIKSDLGNSTLLAFAANQSYNENLKYNIYYDPVTRNHNSPFKYIGLYSYGTIRAVGKLRKVVYCNYEDEKLVSVLGHEDDLNRLDTDEYKRIKEIIENTDYYELQEGLKFFLVDKFKEINFIKSSDYPLRAKKYIWLDEIEGFKEGMTTDELAKLLDGKEWE